MENKNEVTVMIAHEDGTFEATIEKVDYEFIRKTVGGYIEGIYELEEHGIMMWGNEESKLEHQEPNFFIYDKADVVCGTVLFVAETVDEEGESIYTNLTMEQKEIIVDYYKKNKVSLEEAKRVKEQLELMFG